MEGQGHPTAMLYPAAVLLTDEPMLHINSKNTKKKKRKSKNRSSGRKSSGTRLREAGLKRLKSCL